MKNKLLLLSLILSASPNAFSSLTSPSIFKEMQSTNPGVISDRTQKAFSFESGEKGHSFSGSISIGSVETEEGQAFIANDNTKYDRLNKSQSISLSNAYIL